MLRLFFIFILHVPSLLSAQSIDSQLDEAYALYAQGERAQTAQERALKFNEALTNYTLIESAYPDSAELQYNIANCYFQLNEYGWAGLYYWRALQNSPRSTRILHNLRVNNQNAGIAPIPGDTPLSYLLFFHFKLSLGERIQFTFLMVILSFLFWSFYLSSRFGVLRFFAQLMTVFTTLALLSLGFSQYLAPIEAVLVQPTPLHKDAGAHYAEVLEKPTLAGVKVRVLDVKEEGNWLKIETPEGIVGFVSSDRIRVI